MTQTEMNNFLNQINEAFKDQFNKLEQLQARLDQLEEKVNAKEKGSKTRASGSKRVQQAKEDA
jgi:cell division septum initiation protein DivIVA